MKQGKINEMATQNEKQRLELFKDVAGTRVYDDKRAESMELIKKAEDSQTKVNSSLYSPIVFENSTLYGQ